MKFSHAISSHTSSPPPLQAAFFQVGVAGKPDRQTQRWKDRCARGHRGHKGEEILLPELENLRYLVKQKLHICVKITPIFFIKSVFQKIKMYMMISRFILGSILKLNYSTAVKLEKERYIFRYLNLFFFFT